MQNNNFTIQASTSDKGVFIKLEIIKLWNDGYEETIIEFGQHFMSLEKVEEFKKTKLFKKIFKTIVGTL